MADLTTFAGARDGERGEDWLDLREHLGRSYLAYSLSVVKGRAIPDVRDGLKPVQRRTLYAMHRLGLRADTDHKKSARVVGEVIGKYHPHGDQAAYDAMVRMAQDFTFRYPLVDGQGNFGSPDGDNAAAMRYTEARLTPFSEVLLGETDRGTVDFIDNYDGAEQEPEVLPARVPMALLNAQPGVAVGLATDVPSHNLREVGAAAIALYRNPDATTADLLEHIQGPDFPGGGQVCASREELAALYEKGRGSLTLRARWEVEKLAGGDWQVVVTELPPGGSTEQILAEIDALANPQPKKGKKDITSDQKAKKQAVLGQVGGMSNQAGQDTGPVRLVIEPKSKRQKPEELMAFLMGLTSLEVRQKVSLTFIDLDGRPKELGLKEVLAGWTTFRREVVTRRSRARLEKVDNRIHILEGRRAVLLDIDAVIAIVRNAEDYAEAKAGVMEQFALTEAQADDVLAIPLGRLTRMDTLKVDQKLSDLRSEKETLEHLLDSHDAMTDKIVEELEADIEAYGDDRRTLIEDSEPVAMEAPVVDEPVTVLLSRKGWFRSRQGHGLDLTSVPHKDGDGPLAAVETRTTKSVVVLGTNGRAYTLSANEAPGGRGYGTPLSSLVDLQGAGVAGMVIGEAEDRFLLASTAGYGFITTFGDLLGRTKNGKAVLKSLKGAGVLPPLPLAAHGNQVATVSDSGHLAVFPAGEIKEMTSGKGVKLMDLKEGEALARVERVDEAGLALPGKGGKTVTLSPETLKEYVRTRGSRGKQVPSSVVKGNL
ncbi:MAG: DNA topoisomerase IV subunit A [Thiohalorhabdus sp.]|uniref:DNA topoisomerase IV subunit A n=1 Tax=Thiohalorhabdus sp. TaxID=3094134 RepID=UPI0039804C5E